MHKLKLKRIWMQQEGLLKKMRYTTQDVHDKKKKLLYSLTGITLSDNKDIMISNRIDKLKRNCKYSGDIMDLLISMNKEIM